MNYGEKITALRKSNGMTQAELGNALNVTYQAVSKWERNESLPDFATMSKIAKLFNVPLDYFDDDFDGKQSQESEPVNNMIGVCTKCGKVVNSGEEATTSPAIVCKECAERVRQTEIRKRKEIEKKYEDDRKRAEAAQNFRKSEIKRKRNIGFIVGGIVAAVFLVMFIIALCTPSQDPTKDDTGDIVLGGIVLIVFGFTFASQLVWGGAVRSVCLTGGKIVGMPGVIFSLDIDGCIFLIGVKILFAILKFLIFIISALFFVVVAYIISPFTFVPCLIRVCKGIDPDD